MTGPRVTSEYWRRYYAPDNPVNQEYLQRLMDEREEYLRRSALIQQLVPRGVGSIDARPMPDVQAQTFAEQYPAYTQGAGRPNYDQQQIPDTQLIGQAAHWGIPEEVARQMPREALLQIIAQHRESERPSSVGIAQRLQNAPAMFGAPFAMTAISAGQAVTAGLTRIPGLGQWFRQQEWRQQADIKLNELEESVRSTLPQEMQWLATGGEIAGNIAALWVPGNIAWKLAAPAKILGAIPRVGGIAAGAVRGGAAAWMLEGGGEHAQMATGIGAVAGAALPFGAIAWQRHGPAMQAAGLRVSRFFRGDWERHVAAAPEGVPGPTQLGPQPRDVQTERIDELMRVATDMGADETARLQARAFLQSMGIEAPPPGSPRVAQTIASMSPEDRARWVAAHATGEAMYTPGMTPENMVSSMLEGPVSARATVGAQAGLPRDIRSIVNRGISVDQVDGAVAQMNKQALVVESPLLPRAVHQAQVDEVTVAAAAQASNPGGVNIVQGIPDPRAYVEGIGTNWGEVPQFRFARRKGTERLDALMSDQPITDDMVREYETFGFYTGQAATTAAGRDVSIARITGDMVSVRPTSGGAEYMVPRADIMPSTVSPGVREVPGMYDAWVQYVNQQVAETAAVTGGVLTPQRLERIRNENMAGYLEDWLDRAGIASQGERARIRQYFNERIVGEYTALAPEEFARAQGLQAQAAAAQAAADVSPLGRLDEKAATKGFRVVPDFGARQYHIVDLTDIPGVAPQTSRTSITFDSLEAAEEWITQVQRTLPDVSPTSDVPAALLQGAMREAPQMPNINHRMLDDVERALDDFDEDIMPAAVGGGGANVPPSVPPVAADALGPGGGAPQPPRTRAAYAAAIARAKAANSVGMLRSVYDDALSRWMPQRRYHSRIGQHLEEAGLRDLEYTKDYFDLDEGSLILRNELHPHLEAAADIANKVRSKFRRDGTFYRTYLIEDDAARLAEAQRLGFDKGEIGAMEEMNEFFKRFFPLTGLDPAREIRRYIPHVAKKQSMPGAATGNPWDGYQHTVTTDPFWKHMRTGNLNMREMDPGVLMDMYARSVMWERVMQSRWERIMGKWQQIGRTQSTPDELRSVATNFINWANIIKHGYTPGDDAALDLAHTALQTMIGKGITRQQAREIVNMGMNGTHAALLGFRMHVIVRDLPTLVFAVPRAGQDMLDVMYKLATGTPEFRAAMRREAIAAGAVQLNLPRMASPSALQEGALAAPVQGAAAGMRQKALQGVRDAVYDFLPPAMRDLHDTPLHPMYVYGKLQEWMRMVVWHAGKQKADRAIARYRSDIQMTAEGRTASFDALMGESSARTFDPQWQEIFKQLVGQGDDAGAARFIGHQLADATMFKYGMQAMPIIARSVSGKVGMQLGSFTNQYYQFLRESFRNGHAVDKAKLAATIAATTSAYEIAKAKTGWNNLRWMNPFAGVLFTGGPLVSTVADIWQGGQAVAASGTRGDYPGIDQDIARAGAAIGRGATQVVNPAAGLLHTMQGVQGIQNSPEPWQTALQYFITGQRGAGVEIEQMLMDVGGIGARGTLPRAQPPAAPPQASPVRGTPTGGSRAPQGGGGAQF
jgi:hypothetical protein